MCWVSSGELRPMCANRTTERWHPAGRAESSQCRERRGSRMGGVLMRARGRLSQQVVHPRECHEFGRRLTDTWFGQRRYVSAAEDLRHHGLDPAKVAIGTTCLVTFSSGLFGALDGSSRMSRRTSNGPTQ